MGDIIVTLCVGFVSGLIARALHPGKDDLGIIFTAVLGIAGSVVAQWLGIFLGFYTKGSTAGFFASIVGAVLLLFIYGQFKKRTLDSNSTSISDQNTPPSA